MLVSGMLYWFGDTENIQIDKNNFLITTFVCLMRMTNETEFCSTRNKIYCRWYNSFKSKWVMQYQINQ